MGETMRRYDRATHNPHARIQTLFKHVVTSNTILVPKQVASRPRETNEECTEPNYVAI
jgi:hypothetical protein